MYICVPNKVCVYTLCSPPPPLSLSQDMDSLARKSTHTISMTAAKNSQSTVTEYGLDSSTDLFQVSQLDSARMTHSVFSSLGVWLTMPTV